MRRIRGGKEDADAILGFTSKDSSFRLLNITVILVVFVAGAVIGLMLTSHINMNFLLQHETHYFTQHVLDQINSTALRNCTIIQSCEKVDCLNMDRFLHPVDLMHNLSDEQLFWRASLVPRKEDYPDARVPKVSFMFLTRGPLPMLQLWEKYFQGHEKLYSIYVHALPRYKLNVSVSSAFYGRQIPSLNVKWGTVTLADAERRLLANALLDFSNERFVLISESCIPVSNFPAAYKYLVNSALSFVNSYDDPSRYGRGRYSRNMLPEIKLFQWRKGSQWFELERALAVALVSDTRYYTLFRKFCKPACYPDEHYLPTYLNMFHGSQIANRSVTWVDWSLGGPHPAMFGGSNVTVNLLHAIRNNNGTLCSYNSEKISFCFLFARKFAPSTLKPLLNISSSVMGF